MRPSELLAQHRLAIRQVVAAHRATNPRVFGSVAHGEDTEDSNLDLLVDPQPMMSLFDLGAIIAELNELLGIKVDVATPGHCPSGCATASCATPCRYDQADPPDTFRTRLCTVLRVPGTA